MMLLWLIIVPIAGGVLAALLGRRGDLWPRRVALLAATAQLVLAVALWGQCFSGADPAGNGIWRAELQWTWIPQFGISFHLAVDGLSVVLILLTSFIGIMAVASSWREIHERAGLFHLNLMLVLAGITGVFLAVDLFLFYFFWELMLVPMFFLIDIWGHEERHAAAVKFFIFTQLSSLFMLLAILGLYFVHGRNTGTYTFEYTALLGTPMGQAAAMWLMLGFFVAFLVKLGAVPLHMWLPDAHTEAPTAGSVILAGLLLKTGGYGMLRFVLPLFPQAAHSAAPIMMGIAVFGIIYGAVMAFSQTDLKRLVAYTSVSHMGFVLLGAFAWNALSTRGALVQMVAHGLSTGGLFMLVGALQERIHTRDVSRMGGLWSTAPRLAGVGLFLALASMAIPGMGNFIGEFLVLLGTWSVSIPAAAVAVLGMVASAIYSLWLVQVTFHGPNKEGWKVPDFSARESAVATALIVAIVWIGLYPKAVLGTAGPALDAMRETSVVAAAPGPLEAGFPLVPVQPESAASSATARGGRP